MKQIVFAVLFALIGLGVMAQDFEIPENYRFKTKNDYIRFENEIVKAVDWLINTPLGQNKEKRKAVSAFLLQWLTGTPTVTLELDSKIVPFTNCAECLMIYMGGYAKHAILHKDNATKLSNNVAAIEDVITFYTKNKSQLGKNKAIEKYIKLKKKGKLENNLKAKLN